MKFDQFKRIVSEGEKATVDFKITCNAFNKGAGDRDKARAELVKDICAMANNGGQTSYLLIGVANDGKQFQSVLDPNLNSANIQTLVRDSIHPRPAIQVHDVSWSNKVPQAFQAKRFVIIQVGPHPRAAYRFARDYVEDGSKYCFRKHQVWMRNGDTSDVATPEQIVELSRKKATVDFLPDPEKVDYVRLPKSDQRLALASGLKSLFKEMGYRIEPIPKGRRDAGANISEDDFRVLVKVRGKNFVLRCVARDALNKAGAQALAAREHWGLEHGILFVLLGSFSKPAKFTKLAVDFKTDWGEFSILDRRALFWFHERFPRNVSTLPISFLALPHILTSKHLREAVTCLLDDVRSNDSTFVQLNHARMKLNTVLRQWARASPAKLKSDLNGYGDDFKFFSRNLRSIRKLLAE